MKTPYCDAATSTVQFDAVLFLTWSDWETEPRSNRYHYASRFARHVPVLFIQNQREVGEKIRVAASELDHVDLVSVSAPVQANQIQEILSLLRHRGIKSPLLWIYDSINYENLISTLPKSLRVYHATEDYFTSSSAMRTTAVVPDSIRRLAGKLDLVVAVTEPILDEIRKSCGYTGPAVVAPNGCDFEFFARLGNSGSVPDLERGRVVIYQGALNARLDYDLLHEIALLLPDYQFRFVGRCVESSGTRRLRELENVGILGPMSPEDFGREMYRASVGIIPFIQDAWIRNSLPLKTFEYVACGLPVVSVPIEALAPHAADERIIKFACTAEEFADAIRSASVSRHDPAVVRNRSELARANSYDRRFERVLEELNSLSRQARDSVVPLNVALLFDPASCHVGTIEEHLRAFQRFSSHDVTFLPATNLWGVSSAIETVGAIDFSIFDVVIVHYSIRVSRPHHLVENLAAALESFRGLKVLFIQDEYESIECARSWMDRLNFDLVYTCVPLDQREDVYPAYRFPGTDFRPTLTGYVPEARGMDRFVTPLGARRTAIAYRGRKLPEIYGQLGHEKYLIGTEIKRLADAIGLPVDISCEAEARIYGEEWYRFLGSARATLGTESGSNVFDVDGSLGAQIDRLKAGDPTMPFGEIWKAVLAEHDGKIRMNQISPKIFEAIRLRTALILFEGDYSGVVKPDLHYIPLRKDFANFDEVVSKLLDDGLVREMTDRAYADVILSGKYSYQHFIEGVDDDLRARCLRRMPRRLMYGAVHAVNDDGELHPCLPAVPLGLACAADVLGGEASFQGIQEKVALAVATGTLDAEDDRERASQGRRSKDYVVRLGKRLVLRYGVPPLQKLHSALAQQPIANHVARLVYSRMPSSIRSKIKKAVKGG